jgi:gamma-D-glutamyl-L-lysine dipeptidyl-peptidase
MTTPSVAAPTFALVRAPIAPMHAEPRLSSAQVSQTLFGHAPTSLYAQGDWHRVRTLDGYEGWTHAGYLNVLDGPTPMPLSEAAIEALEPSALPAPTKNGVKPADAGFDAARLHNLLGGDAVPRVSLGCTVLAGERRLHLPLGAWVHAAQAVLEGSAVGLDELSERFPRDAEYVVRTATRYFEGTSYQWGGVTPWGADCSGLVQTVFGLHGVSLPRDAWQQASLGSDAGADVGALRPGDLLFFSDRDDRRVTHVGISAGDGRMAHLAVGRGGWALDDLLDENDAYARRLAERFLFARRVL